jgi:hypothetical protein
MQDRVPTEGFTILRLGCTRVDTAPLSSAIGRYGAPVTTIDVPDQVARDIYGHDVMLLRPDMHVVWRGHDLEAPAEIAAIALGHG